MNMQYPSFVSGKGVGHPAGLANNFTNEDHARTILPSQAHTKTQRRRTGRARPQLSLTAALVMAALGLLAPGAQAQAGLNLVLDTGINTTLPARVIGSGDPYLRVGPSNPTVTFNGVTIRYLGSESVMPLVSNPSSSGATSVGTMGKFVVLGDLNLVSNQRIYGIGPNLIRLEVGNNASFAAGAGIDVSGEGRLPGAGGGSGGVASPSAMAGVRYLESNSNGFVYGAAGGWGGNTVLNRALDGERGKDGALTIYELPDGKQPQIGTAEYQALFRSTAGGAGAAGQGNAAVAAGGIERVYKQPLIPGQLPPANDPGVAVFVSAVPGAGGSGGGRGGTGAFGDQSGQRGGNGGNGGNGARGMDGAGAAAIQSLLNASTISLRAGNGGGAGATGGEGLPGASGGGGGGGGASPANTSGERNPGGEGGTGSGGRRGGAGGAGGEGGGGGGGIQLIVRGTLNVASNAGFNATGGQGAPGQAGGAGVVGLAGAPGAPGVTGSLGLQASGAGGAGGSGGSGGTGGTGGFGVGGTGGVVQIAASNLTFNGSINTQGGFSGDFSRSAGGESYIHAYSGASAGLSTSLYFGARAAGSNPYRSFADTFAFASAPASLAPNMTSIIGGAAPYGLLTGETAAPGVTPLTVAEGVKLFAELASAPVPGHKRVGAVTRVNAEFLGAAFGIAGYDSNNSQQVILFSAFSNVAKPALMAVDPTHSTIFGDYIPTGPVALRQGNGYLNDPSLTAGAVAPTDMAVLPARSTFAMYASGTQVVTASFTPYSAPRYFSGTPVPEGNFGTPGASTVFLEDRGLLRLGVVARSVDANSNTGITSQRETTGSFDSTATANLRAGGNNVLFASAQGVGSVDTATSGNATVRTLQAAAGTGNATAPLTNQATVRYDNVGRGQFWGSTEIVLNTKGLAIGTTQRVAEVDFTPEYDDTTRTVTAAVDARLFGPSPRLQGNGTSGNRFTFEAIQAGTAVTSRFSLRNANVLSALGAVWANAINADPELIRLTILGVELVDPSGVFSINGIGNLPMPFALDGDQTAPVDIRFSPTAEGLYTATLNFLTDMNAPVGLAGDIYPVRLFAVAVDEPPALLLLGGGLALLLRRRRRAGSPAHA